MTETKELGKRLSKLKADEEAALKAEAPTPAPGEPEPVPTPEPTPPEPEPEPVEPKPTSTMSAEQQAKVFDRAMTAFGRKLAELFEVDEVQPASTPGVVGFLLPGFAEKRTHDNFTRCATCNGHGKVLTGSLKPPDDERDCPDPRCKGRGYWQKHVPEVAPQATMVPMPAAPANGAGEWGEAPAWMGDPSLNTGTA